MYDVSLEFKLHNPWKVLYKYVRQCVFQIENVAR